MEIPVTILGAFGGRDFASQEQVTITMWNRLGKDTFDSVIAGFQEKYPNIKVKLENMPEAGGDVAQFQAAINGNELPDVFVRPTGYTISLVKLDKVHSLDEVFPADTHGNYTDGTFAEGYGDRRNRLHVPVIFFLTRRANDVLQQERAGRSRLYGSGYPGFVGGVYDIRQGAPREIRRQTYALTFGARRTICPPSC